jgi:hypothetical protein
MVLDPTTAPGVNYNAAMDDREAAARRIRLAFDLHEAGVEMRRQALRREHPDLSDSQIAALLRDWLRTRPGAEHGDAEGRPGVWPRR